MLTLQSNSLYLARLTWAEAGLKPHKQRSRGGVERPTHKEDELSCLSAPTLCFGIPREFVQKADGWKNNDILDAVRVNHRMFAQLFTATRKRIFNQDPERLMTKLLPARAGRSLWSLWLFQGDVRWWRSICWRCDGSGASALFSSSPPCCHAVTHPADKPPSHFGS